MMTLYTFLGVRRRRAIREALASWRETPIRHMVSPQIMCGHPDRKHYSRRMCSACYQADMKSRAGVPA